MKNIPGVTIRRREGKVIKRIEHHREEGEKEGELQGADSAERLKDVEEKLKSEMAGWKANRSSDEISRDQAEERWKKMLNKNS